MTHSPGPVDSFVFAGGGTGGHVFPLLAVADALRKLARTEVVFVGTSRGIETRVIPEHNQRLELLDVVPIRGGGVSRAVRGVGKVIQSLPAGLRLLGRIRPRAVLSIGGYAAGPVGVAAWLRRIPVAILEPNSVLGLANRWLLPFARRAYVAFPELERSIGARALCTGVPLRSTFQFSPYRARADRFHVLVLGGSQGAAVLNERLPSALMAAKRRAPALTVLHQAGRDRDADVRRHYEAGGPTEWVRVVPFIQDVAAALAGADLVVQRSGASAVAETCTVGRPSILVPFARAAGDHQRKNAEALASQGAAVCLVESATFASHMEEELVRLARDFEGRERMAHLSAERGQARAAEAVARDLLAIAGITEEVHRV